MAGHWWAKPQIGPKSSVLCFKNNGMWCLDLEFVFFKMPIIPYSSTILPVWPLTHPQTPRNAHGPVPLRWKPKTPDPKGTKLRPAWNNFFNSLLVGSSLFLATSFNLTYNYATIVPARINQPSKTKHVHLYPNVIYLKCHVGVSIMY